MQKEITKNKNMLNNDVTPSILYHTNLYGFKLESIEWMRKFNICQ